MRAHQVFYLYSVSVHELLRKLSVNEAGAALIHLSSFHILIAIGDMWSGYKITGIML
jgi:hypothetical protein